MDSQVLMSTSDNPFNPFDSFDKWEQYDREKGYSSLQLLDRFAKVSDDLSEAEYNEEINSAIDRILAIEPIVSTEPIVERIKVTKEL